MATKIARRDVLIVGGAATLFSTSGCVILRGGAVHPVYEKTDAALKDGTLRIPQSDLASMKAGDVLEIKPGKPYVDLLLTPDGKGGWLAAQAHCTHRGCVIDYDPSVTQWHCPCHDSFFDEKGKNLSGPAETPIAVETPKVEDGNVVIDLAPLGKA